MEYFVLVLPFTLIVTVMSVFLARNPVYGVLAFVLVVFHVVTMLLLLDLEFLAYVLAIVYIGAIVVLFLFVIMMFYIYQFNSTRSLGRGFVEYYLLGSSLAFVMNELHLLILTSSYMDINSVIYGQNLLWSLSRYFFNEALLLTVLAAFIMLIGIVGAIVLTLKISGHHGYSIKARNNIIDTLYKV